MRSIFVINTLDLEIIYKVHWSHEINSENKEMSKLMCEHDI